MWSHRVYMELSAAWLFIERFHNLDNMRKNITSRMHANVPRITVRSTDGGFGFYCRVRDYLTFCATGSSGSVRWPGLRGPPRTLTALPRRCSWTRRAGPTSS